MGSGSRCSSSFARRPADPREWSLHAKLTIWGSLVLLVAGFGFITATEWSNPATLGVLDIPGRLLAGLTASVQPRTAGFNSVDYAQMTDPSLFATTILMFIGGGSAGTAGGIKVTHLLPALLHHGRRGAR